MEPEPGRGDALGLSFVVLGSKTDPEGLQAALTPLHLSGMLIWGHMGYRVLFSDHNCLGIVCVCVCELLVKDFAHLGPVFVHHLVFYLETFIYMKSPSVSLVLKVFFKNRIGC